MIWDYTTTDDFVKIETVKGNDVIDLIAEIPLGGCDADQAEQAECAAEAICNAHNIEMSQCENIVEDIQQRLSIRRIWSFDDLQEIALLLMRNGYEIHERRER
jgi:hypothetical protein